MSSSNENGNLKTFHQNEKSKTKQRRFDDKKKRNSKFRDSKFNRDSQKKYKDRIAKRLAMIGVASRRDSKKLVLDGKVKINGIECKNLSFLVGYDDTISVNGKTVINKPVRTQIFIMNKPTGCVTTNSDPQGRRTIFELIPSKFGHLIAVGRLDMNTEGIILLTNNGELARLLEIPATALKRVYFAKVVGEINENVLDKLAKLRSGIKIEGVEYGKMIVNVESNDKVKAVLRIVIFEGKNNEIRRIMWHFGLKVVKLTRVQYGIFKLSGLPSGCIKESHLRLNIRELERRSYENAKRYNAKKDSKKNNCLQQSKKTTEQQNNDKSNSKATEIKNEKEDINKNSQQQSEITKQNSKKNENKKNTEKDPQQLEKKQNTTTK